MIAYFKSNREFHYNNLLITNFTLYPVPWLMKPRLMRKQSTAQKDIIQRNLSKYLESTWKYGKIIWFTVKTWGRFHQRSTYNFNARGAQKRKMTMLTWLSFFAHLGSTCIKAVRRKLMKLNPGVNFINNLCAAPTRADPNKKKDTDNLTEILRFKDLHA